MSNKQYRLEYLPTFFEDLEETTTYIAFELHNVKASNDLTDSVEAAILNRLPCAESFEPYPSKYERKHKYYRIYVDNYEIYYVVIDEGDGDKVMEVRRLLYKQRDKRKII